MKNMSENKKIKPLLIKNGYVIDPANNLNGKMDILIQKGCIEKISKSIVANGQTVLDAIGKLVLPGLIDVHTHLRQPGREDKETIQTASLAGAKGGFTTLFAMPNTEPVCDNRSIVEFVKSEALRSAVINILPIGAISVGQNGERLAEFFDMKEAGIVALSDDGHSVSNSYLMRKALEYARMCGVPVIAHCEDEALSEGGVMNEGYTSTRLGMMGIPNVAEAIVVARDILLAELTGAPLHIAHVSTKESIRIIRESKKRGV
ncbi:MAG: dihydroorotase, partial [Candidatus Omnitrophota bacterium]